MSDPLAPSVPERLYQSRRLIFWLVLIAVPVSIAFYLRAQTLKSEATFEYATVLSFGEQPFEDGPRPLMNVQLVDGTQRTVRISPYTVRTCRNGDQVLMEKRGANLRVSPKACAQSDDVT